MYPKVVAGGTEHVSNLSCSCSSSRWIPSSQVNTWKYGESGHTFSAWWSRSSRTPVLRVHVYVTYLINRYMAMCNATVLEGHSVNCGSGWGVIISLSHLIYKENDKLTLLREFSWMACYTWVEFKHSFHRQTYMSVTLEPGYLYFCLSGMLSTWGRLKKTRSALLS